jgi:hypothetical protein
MEGVVGCCRCCCGILIPSSHVQVANILTAIGGVPTFYEPKAMPTYPHKCPHQENLTLSLLPLNRENIKQFIGTERVGLICVKCYVIILRRVKCSENFFIVLFMPSISNSLRFGAP